MLLKKICYDWQRFAKSLAKIVNYFELSKIFAINCKNNRLNEVK